METTPGGEYPPPQPYPQWQWGSPPPPPPPPPPGWGPPPQPYAFLPQPPPYPYASPSQRYTFAPPSHRYTFAPPSHRGRNALIISLVLMLVVVAAVIEVTTRSRLSATNGSAANGASRPNSPLFPAASAPAAPPTSPALPLAAGGVTATSVLTATGGVSMFSDDFTDPASGWDVESLGGGSYAYGPGGYVISTDALVHLLAFSPVNLSAHQISLSMTARESLGAAQTGGFGLLCYRGGDSVTQLRYEFVVNESGRWFIERNQGAVSGQPGPAATILKEGTLLRPLGAAPLTVSGVCATLADGQTTRLALFLDGTHVADITDVAALDGEGWLGGLLSAGGADVPATTTVSHYAEDNLGTDLPMDSPPQSDASSPQLGVNT